MLTLCLAVLAELKNNVGCSAKSDCTNFRKPCTQKIGKSDCKKSENQIIKKLENQIVRKLENQIIKKRKTDCKKLQKQIVQTDRSPSLKKLERNDSMEDN